MKKVVLSLTILFLISLFPLVGRAVDKSLILYFTFDKVKRDEVTDESGNNHTGTLQGGAEWTEDGKYNGTISLDGTDDVVIVKHNESLDLSGGSFTIAVWMYPTLVDNTFRAPINKSHSNNDVDYVLLIRSEDNKVQFCSRAGCAINIKNLGPVISPEKWYHIAVVQDDKTKEVILYVDGVAVGSKPLAGDETVNDADLRIGSREGGEFFGGVIDEVAIFARALTEAEIKNLMEGVESPAAVADPSSSLATTWGVIKAQ